jgi:hypothetical protein
MVGPMDLKLAGKIAVVTGASDVRDVALIRG